MKIVVLMACALSAGCGASSEPLVESANDNRTEVEVIVVPEPESVAVDGSDLSAPDLIVPFTGSYKVTGTIQHDGCNGEIYFATKNIDIDTERLHADIVGRDYELRVEEGRLLAEGRFDTRSCPEATIFERWRLTRRPDGALMGTVESLWLLPPCRTTCLVRFSVQLERQHGVP